MTVSKETEIEIRRLHYAEHWPVGTICSQLGVHEDVVKRVLGLLERHSPQRPPSPRLVDPYADFIAETLKRYPRLRATRLYDMVKPRGYTGSVRTLREYVAGVRPKARRETFLRLEPLIGEQAQVDWAYVGELGNPGAQRPAWLFVIVLAWSRAMWAEFVFDLSAHSLQRSLVRASDYFAGCARQWLFDNAKTVVLERFGDVIRFHPLLVDLAGQLNVQLRVCAPRKPNQKGKVERSIRYLRERFLAGRVLVSIEQGNRELLTFFDEIALVRPHPLQHHRTVGDCFAEERSRLLPLPNPLPVTDQVEPIGVDSTAFVRFDRNIYSVPSAYTGHTVTLVASDHTVRLLDAQEVVAEHERCWGKREKIELPAHREALLKEKRGARQAKGRDRLRVVVPQIDRLFERWVEVGRNVGSMTARTIQLLDLYGDELFVEAVDEMLQRGTHDIGALAQLCEQHRRAHDRPMPTPVSLGDHVPDRDVIPHDLESYDAKRKG